MNFQIEKDIHANGNIHLYAEFKLFGDARWRWVGAYETEEKAIDAAKKISVTYERKTFNVERGVASTPYIVSEDEL